MSPRKSTLIGAAVLLGASVVARAQPQYQPYPYSPAQLAPPAWSYDPYTSGLAPCPQWFPGEPRGCRDDMPPTYGQPNFRSPP